ncbi:PucR family transcriptional regulator [Thermoflavimicrobium daqui]|uniref:PucR family transcriptional regulator n=1 Tax=Thermoflavimicrobium daqui TaxID=2137476 RepID=A0A364K7F4_9BACL|nr:PucR family transcriptional regulator [Thermoflavimicrobium daqui]RAL26214.1 hypothetical protein DL897_04240 [Thermoflavimicrobium daqui]
MSLMMLEALRISPLDRCKVVAGQKGLSRRICSVNSFDAPDVLPWLKQGDLVVTTGYVFKNDEKTQVELIRKLAKRGCAGLGIQINRFLLDLPKAMRQIADECDFPLLEIPYDLSLTDLLLPLLREIVTKQEELDQRLDKNDHFLTKLLSDELRDENIILSTGSEIGLLPHHQYICICLKVDSQYSDPVWLEQRTHEIAKEMNVCVLVSKIDDGVILLQAPLQEQISLACLAEQFGKQLWERWKESDEKAKIQIGIGEPCDDVKQISRSYQEAKEVLKLSEQMKMSQSKDIYHYSDWSPFILFQQLPHEQLRNYVIRTLGELLKVDQEHDGHLIETLETYLNCGSQISETARRLGIHRNTVTFRLNRLKNWIHEDLANGDHLFRLQLAIYLRRLIEPKD